MWKGRREQVRVGGEPPSHGEGRRGLKTRWFVSPAQLLEFYDATQTLRRWQGPPCSFNCLWPLRFPSSFRRKHSSSGTLSFLPAKTASPLLRTGYVRKIDVQSSVAPL